MNINQLITLLLISLICVIGIKSQETCENYNNKFIYTSVVPRQIGVFETLEITNAVNMTMTTNHGQYFTAELDTEGNQIRLSTTDSFINYEKEMTIFELVLIFNVQCTSSDTRFIVNVIINSTNNYTPEFTASSYEIKIPTPIAKGTEITSYLEFNDQIAATDYDLYNSSISFTLTGSDLFYVESVDITEFKSTFKARIFTSQQITKLENDEVKFTLTATDSWPEEPKSSSVKVRVFTDPENTFIESPKFSKPLYRGELEKGKPLIIDNIQLDESTYDKNVRFEITNDLNGIIELTINGPIVEIKLKEGDLPEEVFQQKFIDFVIEAKREGDKSGFAVVIIDISSPIFTFSFEKSLYEGELKEKGRVFAIEDVKLSTNGSLEGTELRLSQTDAQYFNLNINSENVSITLKPEAAIDEIMSKTLLFLTIEATQNDAVVASTNVIIKTIAILIPQFEKNFYTANIENEELKHENIFIAAESIGLDEEMEVALVGIDGLLFDVEINEREVSLKLKVEAEIPKDRSFLNFQILVNNKDSSKKNSAVVICDLKMSESSKEVLQFNSQLYEGKISQDLTFEFTQDIILNTVENVNVTLAGRHGYYFDQQFDENKLVLKLKNGVDIEQFATDFYLQITIKATRENFTSATSNVIIGIERNSVAESAFEKSLYIGNIDDQRILHLENLNIKSENQFTDARVIGDDSGFFSASIQNNTITLELIANITENLLLQKTILNARIIADYEESSIYTNLVVKLPRPEDIKKLAFETSYTSGTIKTDTELVLEIGEFALHPSNYDDTVKFTLTGSDANLFTFDQNNNKIQLKLNQGINEEQISSKKFISMSVIATKEEFEQAEHFIFINVEILDSSESSFEDTLYMGTVDDQKDLHVEKLTIISKHNFSSVEFSGDDFEYFKASIDKNEITISLARTITEDLLVQKTILSSKVLAKYNDISISTNLIVKLPRPEDIKKLAFETSYTSGTIKTDTELVLEIGEFALHPSNYDDTVKFTLTGSDANLFTFDQNNNKIQLRLNQEINEEQISSKKFISMSVIATKEEFEQAEHFIFINVEIFDSSESSFEDTLYMGTVDDQKDLHVEKLIIISKHNFSSVEFTGDDFEYFKASIDKNEITISLATTITEDLLIRKTILAAKVIAQYDDIVISTNIIVTLPRPEEIKKLKFESAYSSGFIRKDPQLLLEISSFSLNPSNYDDSVKFSILGPDAALFVFEQNSNNIQLKLNQSISAEHLLKEFLTFSVVATKEGFEDAEHFVFVNVQAQTSSETIFEHNLYIGQIDDQRDLHVDKIVIVSDHDFKDVHLVDGDFDYFDATITQNEITISLIGEITSDLLLRKSILSAKVVAQFENITAYTNLIVTLPRPDEINKLKFETTYTSGTIKKDTELIIEISEFSLNPSNYDETVQFNLAGSDSSLFSFEQSLNMIQLKLNQGISEEELNSKKFILLSMIATREEYEDAEHFIFINVEMFNASQSSFESNLYVGQVDDQRSLHLDPITIISDHIFSDVKVTDDDFEYFNVSVNSNQVTISLKKEITQDLLIEKTTLTTKLVGQFNDVIITTNIFVTLPRPDEIQSLKFETSHSTGKIVTHPELILEISEISLQTGNYDETVEFILNGVDADLFDMVRNNNKVQLKLKSELSSETLNGKELFSLTLLAKREDFTSAEHFVVIYIEKSSILSTDSFDKSLYIGNVDDQKNLHIETMIIKSNQVFNSVEIIGEDSEFFIASIYQNNVTVRFKEAITLMILPKKGFLNAKIVAIHEDISIYTNLVVELPEVDESLRLSFEAPYTVGNLEVYPQIKLIIHEITLDASNYDETVQFSIAGSDANLFDFITIGNIVQLRLKSGINEESLEGNEYFTLTIKATREGFETAEHFIFVNVLTPEADKSSFDQSLYLGIIDNQRILRLDPLFIDSEKDFTEVELTDEDDKYFAASITQNYVTITLIKEITEDLLLKTSLLTTKVIAKSGDISISTNIIVTLPKVNGDKILRFKSPYYIGTLDQLELDIKDIVLEINNYDATVEFALGGSDKNLFEFGRDQNSIKLSLASDVTHEDLQNRAFLTASITATKDEYASAETVIFVHLNVIVDEITPIEFEKVIYTGSLTYNNALDIDKISLTTNETEIQISHKGDHADKFTINHSNSGDIQFSFISQPIDFGSKFYHFYIEALKFGAPKAYTAVVIEIIDKIQLKFDKVNYFGSFDEHKNLMIDQIPLNSIMASSDVSFRLVDGQNEFFGLNITESGIQITKAMTIAVENLSFVWFYLEAHGTSYYSARTLVVIDFPQKIDIPIDECYDKLDPTQPYFETGSYSFTTMSDETGLVGQIRAIITDPEDSLSYRLLFENIFLQDKITIDKGDIKSLVSIPAGYYRMTGIALSAISKKSAETSILLRVLEPKACEDGKPITTVQKSLAIVKIEENEIHDQIMYMMIGDCTYEITKVVPDALKGYLAIDNTTHYLKNIEPFDREDVVFTDYSVPQVQVTLHLVCPTTQLSQSIPNSIQPYMNEVFTDEILYSPSTTHLNIEILDQNDNAPIFTNPPHVNYRVAFPDEDLIRLIMPKYLFKVEAYDIDDGINAVIRYSTSLPSIFEINSVTGEINPLRTLPDEQTGFLITAIDRAGAGLRTTTSIDFVKISSANVIEIVADNFASKDIDEIALELSEKLKADFRVLSYSQLPFTTNSQVLRFADTQAKTKVYGYAFKSNSLDLIAPTEMMDQLKEVNLTFSINYSSVNGCTQQSDNEDECDLTIWIFAVSFMGTFILFILIAIPVFWYCYLKKKLLDKDSNSNSSKEEIANHFYENDSVRDSSIASEIVDAITEMRASDADIMGIGVNGVTEDESSTDSDKLSNKLMSILEPSSPIHDRKVKFNEMVERIEVIEEADPDTDDIPAHSRY